MAKPGTSHRLKGTAAKPPRAPRAGSADRAQERRDQILRCAIARFAAEGFDKALLDHVAADTGCAKGTLYNYFCTKEEVFTAATDLVMRELIARTQSSTSEDPLERIEHGIRAYLKFFDEHPDYVELLIQERAGFRSRAGATYFQYCDAHADRWRSEFAALMRDGRVRKMPPDQPFQLIGDLLYGSVFTTRMAGRHQSLATRADHIMDLIYNGLLTPEGAAALRTARARRGRGTGRTERSNG